MYNFSNNFCYSFRCAIRIHDNFFYLCFLHSVNCYCFSFCIRLFDFFSKAATQISSKYIIFPNNIITTFHIYSVVIRFYCSPHFFKLFIFLISKSVILGIILYSMRFSFYLFLYWFLNLRVLVLSAFVCV